MRAKSPWAGPTSAASSGYSLLELLAVVSIVSLLAAVALPGFRPAEDEQLRLAAGQVAEALRFARTEAIRTGEVHAVEIFFDTEQVIVSKADMTQATPYPGATPTDPTAIQVNPLTKQPYDFNLAAGVDVVAKPFTYAVGLRRTVLFDAQGMPFLKGGGVFYQLDDATVQVVFGGQQYVVSVAPLTGRVTVQ